MAPLVVAFVGLVVLGLAVVVFVNSSGYGYDFQAYDAAARRVVAGDPLYVPGTVDAYREARYEGLYLYPPTLVVAFLPLTLVNPHDATLAWMFLRVGLLVLGCLALPVAWRARAAVLGVACLSFPVLFDLNIGNVSIVVFSLCAVAWRSMDTPVAAIAHAVLIAVRFPFGVFGVLWLLQRNWRALGWTIAAGLALIVLSLPVVGVSSYGEYFAILRGLPDISVGEHNLSLKSMALELGLPDPVAGLGIVVGLLVGLAVIAFAARRRDASTAFVVTVLATLVVASFIHPHYLVLLLLPSAWLMDRGQWWGIGLPLLGWLPNFFLPLVGPFAIVLVLLVSSRQPKPAADVAAATSSALAT
jgi:hypothetical protein